MADSYEGPIRIMGGDGILLTTGQAVLENDEELGNWTGVVQTLRGTAVAGKALIVELEIPEGGRGRAQLTPLREVEDRAQSTVTGFGTPPF
ncbi:MAG TPA: hypothetical protein VF115_13515 [Acidimicrobiia bacterium]